MSVRSAVWFPALILVASASIGVAIWIGLLAQVVDESANPSIDGPAFGRDFAAFQLAGQRVVSGDAGDLYVFDADAIGRNQGPARFVNPPFYALSMVPLSTVGFMPGYLAWTLLGAISLAVGLLLLGVRYPLAWFVGIVLTLAGLLNTFYGQNSLFTFLLLSASYASLRGRREVLGGAFLGGIAYKPQLLGGFVVWLIYGHRTMWKVVAGAALSLGALAGASVLLIPEAWPRFADAILTSQPNLATDEVQLSIRHAALLLLPRHEALALVLYGVAVVSVVVGQIWFLGRVSDDLALEFASAVSVSVLVAPRGLTYDWLLLAIPLALVWAARPDYWKAWLWSTAVLVGTVLVSVYAAKWQMDEFGRALQLAPVVLGVVLVLAGRILAGESPEGPTAVDLT